MAVLVLTGAEPPVVACTVFPAVVAVTESAVEATVPEYELIEEETGPAIEVAGEMVPPPAQLAGFVAGPGPVWMGLQPGSAFNGAELPMSWLTTGAIVHACLASSLWTDPAKHCGESRLSPVLPMSQPLIAWPRVPGFHPFNCARLVLASETGYW